MCSAVCSSYSSNTHDRRLNTQNYAPTVMDDQQQQQVCKYMYKAIKKQQSLGRSAVFGKQLHLQQQAELQQGKFSIT